MKHRMIAAAACLTLAAQLGAQAAPPRHEDSLRVADSTVIPDRQLFHRSDLYVAAGFALATVALLPADRHLTASIRDEDLLASGTIRHIADAGTFFGGPAPLIIGPAMYLVGRLGHIPRAAELAVHGTEAVVVGGLTAVAVKGLAGRARPYATGDSSAHDFRFGRGFSDSAYQSFPSGHATAAFSAAAAVVAETHEWWPQSTWYVAPIMYGGATMVGLSRVYNDKHWASDVVMGAAIGTFAGLKTVRFNHTHTGNKLDRILLGVQVAPSPNGTGVGYHHTF